MHSIGACLDKCKPHTANIGPILSIGACPTRCKPYYRLYSKRHQGSACWFGATSTRHHFIAICASDSNEHVSFDFAWVSPAMEVDVQDIITTYTRLLEPRAMGGLPSISTKPFARSVIRCPAHDSDSADLKTNTLLVEACCTSLCAFWGRDTKKHGSGGGGCSGVT